MLQFSSFYFTAIILSSYFLSLFLPEYLLQPSFLFSCIFLSVLASSVPHLSLCAFVSLSLSLTLFADAGSIVLVLLVFWVTYDCRKCFCCHRLLKYCWKVSKQDKYTNKIALKPKIVIARDIYWPQQRK